VLLEHLLVVPVHFTLSVLFLLLEAADELRSVARDQLADPVLTVSPPLTFIPVPFPQELLPLSMSLAVEPLAHVEAPIVVKAAALAFAQIITPLPMVLIVGALFLVGADVGAVAVALVVADLAFVAVAIVVVEDGGSGRGPLVLKLAVLLGVLAGLLLPIEVPSRLASLGLPLLLEGRPRTIVIRHHETFTTHVVLLCTHAQVTHF